MGLIDALALRHPGFEVPSCLCCVEKEAGLSPENGLFLWDVEWLSPSSVIGDIFPYAKPEGDFVCFGKTGSADVWAWDVSRPLSRDGVGVDYPVVLIPVDSVAVRTVYGSTEEMLVETAAFTVTDPDVRESLFDDGYDPDQVFEGIIASLSKCLRGPMLEALRDRISLK